MLLFLMFLTLKLTGEVDWSWMVITAPLISWIVGTLGFLMVIGAGVSTQRENGTGVDAKRG